MATSGKQHVNTAYTLTNTRERVVNKPNGVGGGGGEGFF